jgi:hypothetical protein
MARRKNRLSVERFMLVLLQMAIEVKGKDAKSGSTLLTFGKCRNGARQEPLISDEA